MKKIVLAISGLGAVLAVSSASAGVLYQNVVSGTYGQASGYSASGDFAGISVTVDGTNSVTLITYSNTQNNGYQLWYGLVPNAAVTVKGLNSIAVKIDTCSVDASMGCGYVDVVVSKDPKAGGFITDGSLHYTWDNIIVQVAGPTDVRYANITGYVNGVSMDGDRAFIGKYNQVSLMIQTGK